MSDKRLPSEEKVWLKWHLPNARENATEPYESISLYQFVSRKLKADGDRYPAFYYFGRNISRSTLLEQTDRWARMFKGMGVGVDERVIVFIPFTPEAAYIILALDKIGAWPVMLNLGSSAEALTKGCEGARFAVVSDAVEGSIAHALRNNPAFENVILVSVSTDMPFPVKQLYSLKTSSTKRKILSDAKNYMTSADALKLWGNFEGDVEAPVDILRPALVTSSGGTSQAGYSKQILDSNASVISMIKQIALTTLPPRCAAGTRCYTGLPPFISTSTLVLFLLPIYYNMTCYVDPRLDPETFTKNLLKYRPQMCLHTGRVWVYFFTQIERMIKAGKTPDLSFFRIPIMGGDGMVVKDIKWINGLMKQCGSPIGLMSGYGMSEMFSLLSVDTREGFAASDDTEPVVNVGFPMPGSDVAIMDEDGNELTYGERGEICTKGMTLFEGYYNDPERTAQAIRNGWYHSGDIGSIDEDGKIYIYGRMSSCYVDDKGNRLQPFDLENQIVQDKDVHYCLVNNMAPNGEKPRLAVHLVLYHDCQDPDAAIRRIHNSIVLANPVYADVVAGYKAHRHMLRMNKVFKIDRAYYQNQKTDYCLPDGDSMSSVSFE